MAIQTALDSISNSSGSPFGFKNRIINGAMVIDQRNAGASVTPTNGQYTVDRWASYLSQASKYSVQQNAGSVTPPVGFSNYLGVTSSSAYSVLTGDTFFQYQAIEGFNVADLGWGTANAQTITLSFWVRSSLTGTFGGALINSSATRSYPFSYSIPSANTWTQISVTIAGDTSGTWVGATNGIGLLVRFGLGSGSTLSGTAGAWATGNIVQPTGTVSVVGTNGATFYITGVQLEKGSTASAFDYRDYGRELLMCQRYYWNLRSGSAPTGLTILGVTGGGTAAVSAVLFPVQMRSTPTYAASDSGHFRPVNDVSFTAFSSSNYSGTNIGGNIAFSGTSGFNNGVSGYLLGINASAALTFSAEL